MKHETNVVLEVLYQEIEYLKTQIQPTATGHIHTAISVLKNRIENIELSLGMC